MNWQDMARKFEEAEESLISSEREKVEEALRLTMDEYGDYDDAQIDKMKDAYIEALGYERAQEIFKGIL